MGGPIWRSIRRANSAATATIVLGYPEALAMARGELDPADALAAGRVRVRGDLAALVAGQDVLAAAADAPRCERRRADRPRRLSHRVARTPFAASARPPDFGGRYRGQVAVVTGASAGLGAQLCRDLARAGATVAGLARHTGRLEALATQLRVHSPASTTITCDVADTAALRRALDEVVTTLGPIDLLVNNAAQDPGVRLVDIAEGDYRHTFDVNFFAPVAATLGGDARHGRARQRRDRQRLLRRRPPAVAGAGCLPVVQSGALGLHRVHLVPPRSQRCPPPRRLPRLHGDRARSQRALSRGLRRPPPRLMRRSVPSVSRRILARAGGPSLEISVSGLIDAAMVFRAVAPRAYHRLRRNW